MKRKFLNRTFRVTMYSIIFYLIGAFILVYLPVIHQKGNASSVHFSQITFRKTDRILIISPHPDDAALACSGIIEKSVEVGAKIKIVYITYGTHNTSTMVKEEFMPNPISSIELGEERHLEAVKAMEALGLKQKNLIFLGFPDFGTLKMWTDYFGTKPYYSGLTMHNEVFYNTSHKVGVSFTGANELNSLETILLSFKPTKIFYPPLSDLNSDHRASGLFTEAALFDLRKEINPARYMYFVHSEDWPVPYGFYPDQYLTPPTYIKNIKSNWRAVNLSTKEENLKTMAICKHKSQCKTNQSFMRSFIRKNEIFLIPSQSCIKTYLPLWNREIMQKFGITPFVNSAVVTTSGAYINFTVKLFKGVPPFTKLIIFIYPMENSISFENSPKYKIEIERAVDREIKAVLLNNNKVLFTTKENLQGHSNKQILRISINKKYILNSSGFFSAIQLEQGGIRISETPWWNIRLGNTVRGQK